MRKLLVALVVAMFPAIAGAQDITAAPPAATNQQPATQPTPVAVPQPAGPLATIETSLGTIVIALDQTHAPLTVANFIRYAKAKHFDGTAIYRIVPNFVIQMGSYDAKGNYRPTRKPIPLEADNGLSNVRGAVAMARDDPPASATAEFFIDLSDNSQGLDHDPKDTGNTTGYAVFGHVVSGMDVVDRIGAESLGGTGPMPASAPVTPITIEKVTISP